MKTNVASRLAAVAMSAAALAVVGANHETIADAAEPTCDASDVDYQVVGSLMLRDTQFGAANGVYPFGAGRVRVRFENGKGGALPTASLMSYDFDGRFTVKASFIGMATTVVTAQHTTVAHECDGAARGTFQNGEIVWSTPIDGYHSDGSLECSGSFCGKFGAPPAGASPLHEAPPAVRFRPFHFGADGKTFTMPFTRISHSDSPRQTAFVALAGREVTRACVTSKLSCS